MQSRERAIDGPRRPPRVATAYLYKSQDPSPVDHSLIAAEAPHDNIVVVVVVVVVVCARPFGNRAVR